MRKIAVYNHAGGVAKTTTTRDLGYELAIRGNRVLLIDADFQGSLGNFFDRKPQNRPPDELFWHPICHNLKIDPYVECLYENLWIGISSNLLVVDEKFLELQKNTWKFHQKLEVLANSYDFIFIDCPPSINELTIQALVAADEILIPIQPEEKAYAGLSLIQSEIIEANERRFPYRPPLKIAGLLPTRCDRRLELHQHYLQEMQKSAKELETNVFQPIRSAIAVAEACNYGIPLRLHNPKCKALADIEILAESLLEDRKSL